MRDEGCFSPECAITVGISPEAAMSLKLEGGKRYTPKDTDEIRCDAHNFVTTWGELDHIQRLAVEDGLDTTDDLPCIMSPRLCTRKP